MQEDPCSLAPALSIGAISAITGVSYYDDDDEDEMEGNVNDLPEWKMEDRRGDGEAMDVTECIDEVKTEATFLFSGPSSPAENTFSSPLVSQRAQSEPLQPVPSISQEGSRKEVEESSQPIACQTRRQRLRRRKRTKKREPKSKLKDIDYDAVASNPQRLTSSLTFYPVSRVFRKVR